MSDAVKEFNEFAAQCERMAEGAPKPQDKAAWLALAAKWKALAKAASKKRVPQT
jgi:hypothetical protein